MDVSFDLLSVLMLIGAGVLLVALLGPKARLPLIEIGHLEPRDRLYLSALAAALIVVPLAIDGKLPGVSLGSGGGSTAVVTSLGLNLRTEPSARPGVHVIDEMQRADRITVLRCDSEKRCDRGRAEWCRVRYGSEEGWACNAHFVKVD